MSLKDLRNRRKPLSEPARSRLLDAFLSDVLIHTRDAFRAYHELPVTGLSSPVTRYTAHRCISPVYRFGADVTALAKPLKPAEAGLSAIERRNPAYHVRAFQSIRFRTLISHRILSLSLSLSLPPLPSPFAVIPSIVPSTR